VNPEDIGYEEALRRLEEVVARARKEELSIEETLDLLEEGIELAHAATAKLELEEAAEAVEPE